MRSIILGVSKKHVRGANWNRKGLRIHYRGKKSHWHIYYLDELGVFHAERVNPASVPYWRTRAQRILTYLCDFCRCKFRSNKKTCPQCGLEETRRIKRKKRGEKAGF